MNIVVGRAQPYSFFSKNDEVRVGQLRSTKLLVKVTAGFIPQEAGCITARKVDVLRREAFQFVPSSI